jgi:hypothetical protein
MRTAANDPAKEKTKRKNLGTDYQGRATYTPMMQAGGFLYGERHGLHMTAGGDWRLGSAKEIESSGPAEAQTIAVRFISVTPEASWRNCGVHFLSAVTT